MNIKMIRVTAALLAVLLAGSGCGAQPVEDENPVIRIGVLEPLSGADSDSGKQEYLGVLYAHAENPRVKIGGQEWDVELVTADTQSSTEGAAEAARQLAEAGVSVVLGCYGSDAAMAASPVFAENGLAAIGASCTKSSVTQGNDHYFRLCTTDDKQSRMLADFAVEKLDADRVYCLGRKDSGYEWALVESFCEEAEARGAAVITAEYTANCRDFTAFLTHAVGEKADVIFSPCPAQQGQILAQQAAELAPGIDLLGSDVWENEEILQAVQGTKADVYTASLYAWVSESFAQGFQSWLDSEPEAKANHGGRETTSALTALGYDAYMVALEVIRAAGSGERLALLAALPGVHHIGVTGTIAFDDNGDALRETLDILEADRENFCWRYKSTQKPGADE